MKDTQDNFSAQSDDYAKYRPGYPQELFDWLYTHCPAFDAALDCATGNGQAAVVLADQFETVNAIDSSNRQLDNATLLENILYSEHSAERTGFPDNSFDLITVAQALHWLDHERFFKEVERVAKPGALFAAWGYNLIRVNGLVDELVDDFYTNVVGPFWNDERKHVDTSYTHIHFPFEVLPCPEFYINSSWTLSHIVGYLNSWSAVQHYIRSKGTNPVDELKSRLEEVWNEEEHLQVCFPIFMKAGIIK